MRLIALPKPQSKYVATVASETQAACLAPGYKTGELRVRWKRQSCEQMWSPVAGWKMQVMPVQQEMPQQKEGETHAPRQEGPWTLGLQTGDITMPRVRDRFRFTLIAFPSK